MNKLIILATSLLFSMNAYSSDFDVAVDLCKANGKHAMDEATQYMDNDALKSHFYQIANDLCTCKYNTMVDMGIGEGDVSAKVDDQLKIEKYLTKYPLVLTSDWSPNQWTAILTAKKMLVKSLNYSESMDIHIIATDLAVNGGCEAALNGEQ